MRSSTSDSYKSVGQKRLANLSLSSTSKTRFRSILQFIVQNYVSLCQLISANFETICKNHNNDQFQIRCRPLTELKMRIQTGWVRARITVTRPRDVVKVTLHFSKTHSVKRVIDCKWLVGYTSQACGRIKDFFQSHACDSFLSEHQSDGRSVRLIYFNFSYQSRSS